MNFKEAKTSFLWRKEMAKIKNCGLCYGRQCSTFPHFPNRFQYSSKNREKYIFCPSH